MNTEIIIYAYMILCICILFYNIGYICYNRAYITISKNSIEKWKKRIINDCNIQSSKLEKELKNINSLTLFYEALSSISKSDNDTAIKFLYNNKETFFQLIRTYEQKESMKKAYYVYLLSICRFSDKEFEKRVAKAIVPYVIDSSVYCRENTLKALYAIGDVDSLVEAYQLMNKNGITHNSKLVADGLLLFSADKSALAKSLWKHLEEFDSSYQISFITFMTRVSGEFCEEFFILIRNDNTDFEVKYALLRYFRRYYYEPIKEYLYNCIIFLEEMNWEFVAIAVSALDNYPCDKTMQMLKKALSAKNWYVRYNAADSLLKLGVTYLELQNIYDGSDRYAKEMIEYKMQENSIL